MRSKLLLLIAFIFYVTTQAQITVDNTILTDADAEMLVSDVLIGGSGNCAQVSNVSKSTGIDFGGINNGIGSFDATGTDFPFEAGVVLVSGSIDNTPGPNTSTQGNGNWPGDIDLEANTTATNTNDASFIQFDFLPSVDNLSFNFIMASEEYDQGFECTFSDAFAFILTDLTTGVVQNLAVLPGTNIPIEVTNIRPEVPGQCAAVNEEFFDRYNFLPFNDPNTSATNFNGQTVPLTATSPVTSGNPYRIKLVVADQSDSAFDIAVFLEAGSFNLGVDLGEDQTIAGDTNACVGDTVTLDASASIAIGTTFQWQVFNTVTGVFDDIVGETGPTLDVTVTGEYQVLVDSGFGCVGSDSVIVEFASAIATAPANQVVCDDASNDGTEIFNLDALIPVIIGTQVPAEVVVSFHLSQVDAEMNDAALTGTNAYDSPTDEIFIRVESAFDSACFDTASFLIIVQARPLPIDPETVDPALLIVCDNTADGSDTNGLTTFNLASLNGTIFGAQDPTAFTLTYHLTFADADTDQPPLPLTFTNTDPGGQTIFVRLENDAFTDCYSVIPIDLVVAPLPVIIDPAPLLTQCDDDTDGFSVFNLLEAGSLISADAANETFQFFDSLGNPIADPIAYTNSVINNETLDVIVSTVNGCSRPAQLLLEVDTSQIPPDFLVAFSECDTDDDGVTIFDFATATPQILALFPPGQLLTVTYYETLQEAQSEINPITNISNYTNNITLTDINGVQDIYVRVDGDTANDCVGLGVHVQLTVLPNPVLNKDVTDFVECSDSPNFGIFDLTSKDAEITGGNPDYAVSYYASAADYLATPPIAIPNPTLFNGANGQEIFYSAENTITGCVTFDSTTLSFMLEINENPDSAPPSDLLVCDEDGTADELTTMDLTVKDTEVTGGFNPSVTVSYHLTLAGANADDASIPDPTAFTNTINPQIIFARVTDNITGCFSTEALRVEVFLVPTPVTPADLEVCDIDNDGIFDFFILSDTDFEITAGDTSLTVAYYLTEDDANNAPSGLEINNMMYVNVNDPFFQTIYARVFNAAGCFAVVPFNLVILNTPMPNETPDPYAICDDNADGIAVFDLTSQEPQILDGLDPAIFDVTWFVDQASVDANVAIADPTAHTSNTTTVIAVVTDIAQSTTTFCSVQVDLDLIVNPLPTPVQPALYELCDDLASGSDTDEFSVFDLRSRDDEIVAGNADWVVSYYLTQTDADNGMPTLPDMYQNATPASQTIWVRVENVVTSCYDLITLTLVVNQLPSPTTIDPVEVCDDDFDGIAIFDLTIPEVSGAIINGETNFDISFHESLAFAQAGTPAIADPANYASPNATIFVRATDNDPATSTECFRIIELELVVNPIPAIALPVPDITECTNGTTQFIFDLTQNDGVIYGTLDPMDYNLTYHESEANADDGEFPIADPVNYLVTDPGVVVWVRLENILTGCATVTFFNATIAPLPVFTPPTAPLEACDAEGPLVGTDIDGITIFDLTLLDAGIVAGDTTLAVTYYETQADLDAGIFIDPATAYVNTIPNNQTIFVQVSSTTAGMCMGETTAELLVNPVPFIDPVPPAIACDDDNDGFGEFDLQGYANDLGIGLPDVVFRFYETFDNAQIDDGTGQIDITVLYNNISGMTELFFVAENTVTGCEKLYSFELLVFPMPDLPLEIDDLRACDDDADGFASFDLTSQETAILVNIAPSEQANFTVTYHNTMMDAMDGTAAILTPDMYVNQVANTTETIFVRVETNDGTPNNCPSFVEFDIEVVPPPVINPNSEDLNITVCNDDDDPLGTVEFDLTLLENAITGGDDLVSVTYYASLADLASDTPITTPEAYTNITNPQTIHIVVAPFDLPECSTQGLFDIEVLPLPSPGTPAPVVLCDDALDGDDTNGIVAFDLSFTVTEITGGETVVVSIFDDLTLAEATPFDPMDIVTTLGGGGEILYTNTVPGGQTLYARVESTVSIVNGEPCFVIVPFDVVVNPLPILAQDAPFEYTFCEEFDGDDTVGEIVLATLADDAGFLVAPQNTADFTISYHSSPTEADNGAFPIDQVILVVTDDDEIFFRIENTITGCFVTGSVVFTVESRPLANPVDDITQCADDPGVNGIPVQDVATFDLTEQDNVITAGEPTTSVVYYTSLIDAQNMENPIDNPTAFVNTSDPQTIYARAINTSSMCESTDVIEFMIFVEPLPYTDLTNEGGEICVDEITGEALDPFIIDGTVEDALPDVSYAYTWTRDGTLVSLDPTVTIDQQGEYELTITATYDNGMGVITSCDYVAVASYVAVSAPVFEVVVLESSFNPGGVYTVEVQNITGFNSNPEDFEFALDDGPFQSSTTFTGVTPGDHTIFGRRASGDCSISQVTIGIVDYPRFFTPNQDGFHDTWNIIGIGVAPNLNAQIYIFDRSGKLLKQISPTSEGWDGTFNGQPMISDDYWFRVNYTEPDGLGTQREFVGHFTLKR